MGRLRLARATVLLAVAAAACSGGDGKKPAEEAQLAPVTSTTEPSFTGAGSERFCREVGSATGRLSELATSTEPDSARRLFTSAQEALATLVDAAPAEIRSDLNVLAGAYRQLLDGLRKVDFDVARLPPEVTGGLNRPEVRTAGDRLGVYQRKICGQGGS